jgi:hypothetical protein
LAHDTQDARGQQEIRENGYEPGALYTRGLRLARVLPAGAGSPSAMEGGIANNYNAPLDESMEVPLPRLATTL